LIQKGFLDQKQQFSPQHPAWHSVKSKTKTKKESSVQFMLAKSTLRFVLSPFPSSLSFPSFSSPFFSLLLPLSLLLPPSLLSPRKELIFIQLTEEHLKNFFSECGVVTKVALAGDASHSTRFAFVEFADLIASKKALSKSESTLSGHTIKYVLYLHP
jgi:RNA recognition motif